ncbi:MAG: hypothetical protein ABSH10_06560 [Phycisphaerae bacterium]
MSKKKNAPALYELIQKGKGGFQLNVPPWMTGGKKPQAVPTVEPPAAAEPSPAETAEPPEAPKPPKAVAPPPVLEPSPFDVPARPLPAAAARPRKPERLIAKEGKWLKLALTPAHAVAAGVVLVVLIAIVFVLGRVAKSSSRHAPPAANTPAVAKAPMVPAKPAAADKAVRAAVVERHESPLLPKTAEPAKETKEAPAAAKAAPPAADGAAELKKGKYYLVVQGLRGMDSSHRADADAIAAFLNANGEPVTVMTYKGTPQQYIVLSKRGFDSPDSPEAKKYLRAIEEQGKLYKNQGGKYDFNQGESGWFVKM